MQHLSALVAGDLKTSRDLVGETLRTSGMRDIRHAVDGGQTIRLLRAQPSDFVILDFEMPHDGVSTLRQIRTSPDSPNRRACVIMLTAYATHSSIMAMRDAGASEIITKPLTAAKLLGRLQSLIVHPREFVDCHAYVGPERRRTRMQAYSGPLRRSSDRTTHAQPPAHFDVLEI